MRTRQALINFMALPLLAGLSACSPANPGTPIPTPVPSTPTPAPALTNTPIPPTPAATPLTCLSKPGRVKAGSVSATNPAQDYLIYLPPCYDEKPDLHYPVLYLFHGQTYTNDQWIRLGAVDAANQLILSGGVEPFLIVFPDDRYWNLPPGPGFGQRVVDSLVPYIDQTYRTLPDREHRAVGGMSRGAGWALRLGLTRWDLFGTIGLHSLAVFMDDGPQIEKWLKAIPPQSLPRVFMDVGDNDQELNRDGTIEALFTRYKILHEWHLYSGAHTEEYWNAHVEEYIRWYAEGWSSSHLDP